MSEEVAIDPTGGGRSQLPLGDDRLIGAIAARQEGHASRLQLLAAGLSRKVIDHRVARGRLYVVHPGVYAVGCRTRGEAARGWAALLAAGEDGLISHLAAAGIYGIRPHPLVIDVTTPRHLRSRDGIRMHRRVIHPAEVRVIDGLPLTSPSQTLFDLATMLGSAALAKAANQAFVLRLCTLDDLSLTRERNRRRKGAAAFDRLLATLDPEDRTIRSPLESRLARFLRERGFPPWESNVRLRVGTDVIEPDFLWRDQRVIVEADGRDAHLAPLTFASDRRRDRRLSAEGWHPVRVTSADLDVRPAELERDLWSLVRP